MTTIEVHDEFAKKMAEKYPRYFGEDKRYGGFCIGEGWYPIIEALIGQIDHHIKWRRKSRLRDLRLVRAKARGRDAVIKFLAGSRTPTEWDEDRADEIMNEEVRVTPYVQWIHVDQIKEKFGGLRFYYQFGDDTISGMVNMAESWAARTCEQCGNIGERRSGGWVRTLCDEHEAERQAKYKEE